MLYLVHPIFTIEAQSTSNGLIQSVEDTVTTTAYHTLPMITQLPEPDAAEGYLSIELEPLATAQCDSEFAAVHGYPQEW